MVRSLWPRSSYLRRVFTVAGLVTALSVLGSHFVFAQDSLFVEENPLTAPTTEGSQPIVVWSHGPTSYFSVCPAGDSVSSAAPSKIRILVGYFSASRNPIVGVPPTAIYVTYTTDGTLRVNDQPSPIYADDSTNASGTAGINIASLSGSGHLIVTLHVDGIAQSTPTSLEVRSTDTNAGTNGLVEVSDTTSAFDLNRDGHANDGATVFAHVGHWHRYVLHGTLVRRTSLCGTCEDEAPNTLGESPAFWSPDGRYLSHSIFVGSGAEGDCHIFLTPSSPENGNVPIPFSHPPLGIHDYDPSWSPLGTTIAFDRGDSCLKLKGLPCAGCDTTEHLLYGKHYGIHGTGATTPAISPDGLWVAFTLKDQTQVTGHSDLWVIPINGDTLQLKRLTTNENVFYPQWSPDGAWIYYTQLYDSPHAEARRVRADLGATPGSELVMAHPTSGDATQPSPSPDSAVVVLGYGTSNVGIRVVNPLLGSGQTGWPNFQEFAVEGGGTVAALGPRFSPDGTRLVTRASPPSAPTELAQLWAVRRNMNLPPVIGTVGGVAVVDSAPYRDATIEVGEALSQAVTMSDPEGDAMSDSAFFLKDGMSYNTSTHTLSWTPSVASIGHNNVKLFVTTQSGGTDYAISRIAVLPVKVSDLACPFKKKNSAVLTWTEPDQGTGDAEEYDIRYRSGSEGAVTESNFASSHAISPHTLDGTPLPGDEGTEHCLSLTDLTTCTTYYFGMKTRKGDLWSKVGNTISMTTDCSGSGTVFCDEEGLMAGGGGGGGSMVSQGLDRESASLKTQTSTLGDSPTSNSFFWGPPGAQNADLLKLNGAASSDTSIELRLSETGDRQANVDYLSFAAVDHSPEVSAFAGPGSVYTGSPQQVSSILDHNGQDITSSLGESFTAGAGEQLTVALGQNQHAVLLVESHGEPGVSVSDSIGILVEKRSAEAWTTIGTIQPRREFEFSAVDAAGADTVRLTFLRGYALRSITKLSSATVIQPLAVTVTSATHSRLGSVRDSVLTSDGNVTVLLPGDELTLAAQVSAPVPGTVRDVFLLGSGGFSRPMHSAGGNGLGNERAGALVTTPVWHFALGAAHPNPSQGNVTIEYTLAQETPVSIRVYNVAGRLVKTLVSGTGTPGPHDITWNAADDHGRKVGAGVYFYRMEAGTWRSQRKVVFLEH